MKKSRSWLWFALIVPTVAATILAATLDGLGGTNPYTPPGHEGYVSHQPLWIGQRGFVRAQSGATSPGWQWRHYVTNIDMRPQNYSESMEINHEIQRKLAAEQDLERMAREQQIAEQEAAIMVTNARGRAAAQRVVNETLTPLYVQHEMLTSFERLSRTDRATFIVAPMTDSGASPVLVQVR